MLAKSTRDDFIFRFDTRSNGEYRDVGWEILPECPSCSGGVTHADTKELRVIEHVGMNEINVGPPNFSVETDEYTTYAGVVYPCEHVFEDTRELFFYLMRYHGLSTDIEAIERAGMDTEPIREELANRKERISETELI